MPSYQKLIMIGHLTRDPELKNLPNGKAICKFGIAVNRNWTTDTGEKKEEVCFVDVDCFGRTAENVAQYMRKGSALLVEGRLKLDQWDDKATGAKRSKLGVVAETVTFMGGRKSDEVPEPPVASGSASDDNKGPIPEGDDVPF